MRLSGWLQRVLVGVSALLLGITACTTAPSSQYDTVQAQTSGARAPAAVDRAAQAGSASNRFFPASAGDYTVVPSQEKAGFAEYKLKQNGQTLAMLSINDTLSVPAAAAKYDAASETIAGYPAVSIGTTATGVLVNGRYQVKELSRNPAFTATDRAAWLQKFDLAGLAQLDT